MPKPTRAGGTAQIDCCVTCGVYTPRTGVTHSRQQQSHSCESLEPKLDPNLEPDLGLQAQLERKSMTSGAQV